MKIVILTNTLDTGGAEVVAVNLANAFVQLGHQTDLIVFKGEGQLLQRIDKGVMVHVLGVKRTRFIFFKLYKKINKEIKPDIVISNMRNANMILATICFFKKSFKVCFREAAIFESFYEKSHFATFLYAKVMNFIYKKADIIVANSKQTRDDLVRFSISNKEKVFVIDNPIVSRFLGDHKNDGKELKYCQKQFTVIFVGRLIEDKNCDKLIVAFAKVKSINQNCQLLVLGDGPENSKLQKLAIDLGISNDVCFLGNIDNVFDYLRMADLFVLPSKYEGFGNVIVEAVVAGLPLLINECEGGAVPLAKRSDYYKITDINDENRFSNDLLGCINRFRNIRQTEATIQRFKNDTNSIKIANLYLSCLNSITK